MLDTELLIERIKTGKFKSVEFLAPTDFFKTNIRRIEFHVMLDSTFMHVYGAMKMDKKAKRYNFCLSSVQQVEDDITTLRLISFPFFVGEKGKSFVLTLSVDPLNSQLGVSV